MSTSNGEPSKKISWYKSMIDKLDYDKRLQEEAAKVAKNPNYKPRVTIGKKNKHLFERYVAENKNNKRVDKPQ